MRELVFVFVCVNVLPLIGSLLNWLKNYFPENIELNVILNITNLCNKLYRKPNVQKLNVKLAQASTTACRHQHVHKPSYITFYDRWASFTMSDNPQSSFVEESAAAYCVSHAT